ncbi:MAG TPA: EscU/YscU/HrcU family type III secretion system export apparatus switch protein [bacterium]|nr:EscU/YscU/HrcU family type III secretion system export apparatus switch protein [bacterium]
MRQDETKSDQTRKAAALRYRPREDAAPMVVAKGRGLIAERIIAIAKEHEIPIFRDDLLVGLLINQPLDRGIPPTLYEAVAQVLAFLYRLKRKSVARPKGVRENAVR